MVNIKIEEIAVNAVKTSMLKIDRLKLYISEGDKMPAWDGDIIIHKDGKQTKDNLKIVRCQVKGKVVNSNQIQDKIKYSVETKHLIDYQRNSGVIFFVVYIDKKTKETLQIYYSTLLPIKISKLIKGREKQQRMSVTFRKFPKDENGIMMLLLDFYNQSQMQASFAQVSTPTLDELDEQGCLEQVIIPMVFPVGDVNEYSMPKFFEGNEMTIYATTKGNPIPIPVEFHENIVCMTVQKTVHNPVFIGKKQFFDSYNVIINSNEIIAKIGDCCSIVSKNDFTVNNVPVRIDINLSIKGSLNERINKLSFFKALVEEQSITCGSVTILSTFTSESLKQIHYDEIMEDYRTLLDMKSILEALNISKDLDIDNLSDDDFKKLGVLYDVVINHKILYRKFPEKTHFVLFEISNLNILMVCTKVDNDGYKLTNFFDSPVIFSVNDDKGKLHETNQYLFICTDYCKKADNYNITRILEGVKCVFDDSNIYQVAYIDDDMIKMFDKTGKKSYIGAAESLNELLLTRKDIIDEESAVIDKMQIAYRQRKLIFAEKQMLSDIAKKSDCNISKLGAFILLDEKEEADAVFALMVDTEKEELRKLPIYNLYKKMEDLKNGQT